jgi:glycosyltransferase involved in cell wall biosynthesis
MKLIIDGRHLKHGYSGLASFTFGILVACSKRPNFEYKILLCSSVSYAKNSEIEKFIENEIMKGNIIWTSLDIYTFRNQIFLPNFLRKYKGVVYLYPHFDGPIFYFGRMVIVIHDLFPFKVPNYFRKYAQLKKLAYDVLISLNLCKRDVMCFVPTKTTLQDVYERYKFVAKDRLKVCSEGCSLAKNCSNIRRQKSIQERYLLYVGDMRPHKNIPALLTLVEKIQTWHQVDIKLVMVGDPTLYDPRLSPKSFENINYEHLGFVSNEELYNYYLDCDSLILLSDYEGFGLPILEAGRLGRKIICSNGGALVEIAPPWAKVHDISSDVDDSFEIASYLNNDEEILLEEVEEYSTKFSWHKTLSIILSGIE